MTEDAVRGMLGTIDQRHLVRLLDALSAGAAQGVLAVADELATRGLSYAARDRGDAGRRPAGGRYRPPGARLASRRRAAVLFGGGA
ncbi:hypothetical protein G6F54_014391 [Rhizopus delemar]|nr:hypothetical protein G6F54_014391 [Rhizopus delemar]